MRTSAGVALFAALFSVGLEAQSAPLVTDRPDFTESPLAVPRGSVQLELGAARDSRDGFTAVSAPDALLRWSPWTGVELRFEPPSYFGSSGRGSATDIALGAKVEAGSLAGWSVAAILGSGLPTGSSDASAGEPTPELILTTGRELGDAWSLGSQVSALHTMGSGSVELASTMVIGLAIAPRFGVFAEVAGRRDEEASYTALAHGGLTMQVVPRLQLDLHAAVGIYGDAPNHLIGFGLSTRSR